MMEEPRFSPALQQALTQKQGEVGRHHDKTWHWGRYESE